MSERAIRKIPVKSSQMIAQQPDREAQRLRVAAYCRVSTEHEEQESSYEAQCRHYTYYIRKNPEWAFAGIYADEGISGVSTRKREQFNAMIKECEAHNIDLIITKSISRFARNTLDCLNYIRKLKELGIPVIFEKEKINTMDAKGEVLITIMASIAQQESESISRNVQMGIRYHYQEGRVCAGCHRILGYKRTEDGSLEVVPEEAPIVRRIFREYLDGFSPKHIAERLRSDGLTDRNGKCRNWTQSSICYVLKNEKYSGDLLLQKYFVPDFLTKKVQKNTGQLPQYYVENNHEPIVPKEIFLQTQGEMIRRSKAADSCYNHKMSLSGRIVCGVCGTPYHRLRRDNPEETYWCCATKRKERYKHIQCDNSGIREVIVRKAICMAINMLVGEREELESLRRQLIEGPIAQCDAMLEELEEMPDEKREVMARRADFAEKERRLRDLLTRLDFIEGKINDNPAPTPIDEFYMATQKPYELGPMQEVTEDEINMFIDKVVVLGKDKAEIHFKAGVIEAIENIAG